MSTEQKIEKTHHHNELWKMDIDKNISPSHNFCETFWDIPSTFFNSYPRRVISISEKLRDLSDIATYFLENKAANMSIELISFPIAKELVARKVIRFNYIVKGGEIRVGTLIKLAVKLYGKNGEIIKEGLLEKRNNRSKCKAIPVDCIIRCIIPYKVSSVDFEINKGSAKRKIIVQVSFELRLYHNSEDMDNYVVIDKAFSPPYRIFTHSSQLGRER